MKNKILFLTLIIASISAQALPAPRSAIFELAVPISYSYGPQNFRNNDYLLFRGENGIFGGLIGIGGTLASQDKTFEEFIIELYKNPDTTFNALDILGNSAVLTEKIYGSNLLFGITYRLASFVSIKLSGGASLIQQQLKSDGSNGYFGIENNAHGIRPIAKLGLIFTPRDSVGFGFSASHVFGDSNGRDPLHDKNIYSQTTLMGNAYFYF